MPAANALFKIAANMFHYYNVIRNRKECKQRTARSVDALRRSHSWLLQDAFDV